MSLNGQLEEELGLLKPSFQGKKTCVLMAVSKEESSSAKSRSASNGVHYLAKCVLRGIMVLQVVQIHIRSPSSNDVNGGLRGSFQVSSSILIWNQTAVKGEDYKWNDISQSDIISAMREVLNHVPLKSEVILFYHHRHCHFCVGNQEDCKMQLTLELSRLKCYHILDSLTLEAVKDVKIQELHRFVDDVSSDESKAEDATAMLYDFSNGIVDGLHVLSGLKGDEEAIIFPISRGSFGPCTDELRGVINIAENERRMQCQCFISIQHILFGLSFSRVGDNVRMLNDRSRCSGGLHSKLSMFSIYKLSRTAADRVGDKEVGLEHLVLAIFFRKQKDDPIKRVELEYGSSLFFDDNAFDPELVDCEKQRLHLFFGLKSSCTECDAKNLEYSAVFKELLPENCFNGALVTCSGLVVMEKLHEALKCGGLRLSPIREETHGFESKRVKQESWSARTKEETRNSSGERNRDIQYTKDLRNFVEKMGYGETRNSSEHSSMDMCSRLRPCLDDLLKITKEETRNSSGVRNRDIQYTKDLRHLVEKMGSEETRNSSEHSSMDMYSRLKLKASNGNSAAKNVKSMNEQCKKSRVRDGKKEGVDYRSKSKELAIGGTNRFAPRSTKMAHLMAVMEKEDVISSRVTKGNGKARDAHGSLESTLNEGTAVEMFDALKDSGYEVGDMVWGKVKSHPWLPGQIFDEALASPSICRAEKEGQVLVAFYGDGTYGWLEPGRLIPFDFHYTEKSKQTNTPEFLTAVEEAVDEVKRRAALGLSCRCRKPNIFRPKSVEGFFEVDVNGFQPGGLNLKFHAGFPPLSGQPMISESLGKRKAFEDRVKVKDQQKRKKSLSRLSNDQKTSKVPKFGKAGICISENRVPPVSMKPKFWGNQDTDGNVGKGKEVITTGKHPILAQHEGPTGLFVETPRIEKVKDQPSALKPLKKPFRLDDPAKASSKSQSSRKLEKKSMKRPKNYKKLSALAAEKKEGSHKHLKIQRDEKMVGSLVSTKPEILEGPSEPAMLKMKFPLHSKLPSVPELKAKFVRFGNLYESATRAAYNHAVLNKTFLGNIKANYRLQVLNVSAPELPESGESSKHLLEGSLEPKTAVIQQLPLHPSVPLKSILKKSPGDEMMSINSVKSATRHVRFKLEGNASSGEEKMLPSINKISGSIIGTYLNPISSSRTTIKDNVANLHQVMPPTLPLQPENRSVGHIVDAINMEYPQGEATSSKSYQNASAPTNSIDISQQMLYLLKKCSEIVADLKSSFG
ncbi:unnamed protein product [Camellia sinensis]